MRADLRPQLSASKAYLLGADMSKPAEIEDMVDGTPPSFGTRRHPRQQRRHPARRAARGVPAPKVGRDPRDQSLVGVPHHARRAFPAMKARNWGRIINVASAHGLVASPFKSAYVAAKHGIVGLTKVAALETAEDGITCNAICPGYVYTPLVEAQIDDQAKAHNIPREQVIRDVLLANQPNKRFATVEEIGALAAVPGERRRRLDHRRRAARRRRLDRALTSTTGGTMNSATAEARAEAATPRAGRHARPINLALQGGGAHGAFAWGVLDRLLEDERIAFEGISATSAGAMNAAVLAYGLTVGGRDGAKRGARRLLAAHRATPRMFSPAAAVAVRPADAQSRRWRIRRPSCCSTC